MDKTSEQIIELLRCAAYSHPMLRTGQIVIIAAKLAGWESDGIFYIPDDILLKGLKLMMERDK